MIYGLNKINQHNKIFIERRYKLALKRGTHLHDLPSGNSSPVDNHSRLDPEQLRERLETDVHLVLVVLFFALDVRRGERRKNDAVYAVGQVLARVRQQRRHLGLRVVHHAAQPLDVALVHAQQVGSGGQGALVLDGVGVFDGAELVVAHFPRDEAAGEAEGLEHEPAKERGFFYCRA